MKNTLNLEQYPRKLNYSDDSWQDPDYWIGAPESLYPNCPDSMRAINEHRSEIVLWGYVTDDDANYSYDDWVLIELYDVFYLLNTTGCSCPSPRETWTIATDPGTLEDQWNHLRSGNYHGWSVPGRQMEEFRVIFQNVAKKKKMKDFTKPVVNKKRYEE